MALRSFFLFTNPRFQMFHCYILYSAQLDRYYIGSCGADLAGRLARHLTNHKGFTSKAKDWRIVLRESYASRSAAYARERQLKSWKSRSAIEELIRSGG